VVTQFGQWWATVMAVSGEALALGMAPVVVVATDGPPLSKNSAREVLVRRLDGVSSSNNDD
jgi:hypothetical protein